MSLDEGPLRSNDTFKTNSLGDDRNLWWNKDFLELMSKRWRLAARKSILDLGCGAGHWTRELLELSPPDTTFFALDINADLVAAARTNLRDFANRIEVIEGSAYMLPYEDNSMDMVTCQTLLIHMENVQAVLAEAYRVLKSGGILVAAEPNNLARNFFFDSHTVKLAVHAKLGAIWRQLEGEERKVKEGKGYDSIGNLLYGELLKAGFLNIESYISDKVNMHADDNNSYALTPALLFLVSGEKP